MKKSIIWLLITVMAFAFIGLLYIEITYMERISRMRNEQFSELVTRSLNNVSSQLEKAETLYYLDEDLKESMHLGGGEESAELYPRVVPPAHPFDSDTLPTLKPRGGSNGGFNNSFRAKQEVLKGQYLYQKGLLNEVILNLLSKASDRPIRERADSATVSNFIRQELDNNGLVGQSFEFAVVTHDKTVAYSTAGYEESAEDNVYTQVLFPNDPNGIQHQLNVSFPNKRDYIFKWLGYMTPSFAFTFILLCVFVYTIIVAFRQKKLSEMKNDFINNMTHEFKTPISSISLAAQMLGDDEVTKSPALLNQAVRVIGDETKRLRFLVEKVLQLSMFDRRDATMKLDEVDANAAIDAVVRTHTLKVEKYGGSLDMKLDADDPIVMVDEMHFTNVIFNLLDNAIKYRRDDEPPRLLVTTRNAGDTKLVITVEDNGIGMKRDELKKIFEKFYRVSTGNRHDVKGFGLGLAYVHKMISLFNGEIRAESEVNKGSKFIITLPLIN